MSKIKDELKFDGKDTYFHRFLKRSSDENIINYINNATKENINIFLEYEDEIKIKQKKYDDSML